MCKHIQPLSVVSGFQSHLAPAEAADLRGSLRSQSWAPKPEGSKAHLRRFGREAWSNFRKSLSDGNVVAQRSEEIMKQKQMS